MNVDEIIASKAYKGFEDLATLSKGPNAALLYYKRDGREVLELLYKKQDTWNYNQLYVLDAKGYDLMRSLVSFQGADLTGIPATFEEVLSHG